MPKVSETPAILAPFHFHGVDFDRETSTGQAIGSCPFCAEDAKFYVSEGDGRWDCKSCKLKGNANSFLSQLYDRCLEGMQSARVDVGGLADSRRLLHKSTLSDWGVVQSVVTGEWLVPAYSASGKLCQLYRYVRDNKGRFRLFATAGLPHGLFGMQLYDPSKPFVYIFEGPWDAMAFYEVARRCKKVEGGILELTASESDSLYATCNILAVPGCKVFYESWCGPLKEKHVGLLFDNDHPREVTYTTGAKAVNPPDALEGMKSAANLMSRAEAPPPQEVLYLQWGETDDEMSHNPDLPAGYDVRDALTGTDGEPFTLGGRVAELQKLFQRLKPIPSAWLGGKAFKDGSVQLEVLPCNNWRDLTTSWRKALKWAPGMERAFAVMLASIASTGHVGDQLWVKIMGPASCGKSTLCEAISVAKKYVMARSSVTGFHSGYKSDKEGTEDHSIIVKLAGKTLITKDGDSLLTAGNIQQILSEARDLYDRVSRKHFRHGLDRDYEDISITWILCGTASLRTLDSSELGERFLSCYIMKEIDTTMERQVARRSAFNIRDNFGTVANGTPESRDTPEKIEAKRLTGGYIEYLRSNAHKLMKQVSMGDKAVDYCLDCAEFIAYMRARPSVKQEERVEREISTRLGNQLTLLAGCMAVVMNHKEVDDEILEHVRQVAMDTSDGRMLDIVTHLYQAGSDGLEATSLSMWLGIQDEKLQPMLRFLKKIKVLESFKKELFPFAHGTTRWRLTQRLVQLYSRIMEPSTLYK